MFSMFKEKWDFRSELKAIAPQRLGYNDFVDAETFVCVCHFEQSWQVRQCHIFQMGQVRF